MGGKSKQSQRTKNNVRPSSSGRTAELLSNAVHTDTCSLAVAAAGGKSFPALFPTMHTASMDQRLNSAFALCIKKLNKKDPITKTKALQELGELVNRSAVEDAVAVLPSWAHCYRMLSADSDHKVREATQVCHGSIVGACGRQTAPHLRALLPPWVHAQYDEYAPAAAAARHSLASTFPKNKLPEVISFCKTEVIAHLHDNLIGKADTLLKKTDSVEDRELHQRRIVTSSLQGLEYLCEHLPSEHGQWLWGRVDLIVRDNSFWKLAQHASPQLRAAWYASVGRCIARFGDTFGAAYGARATRTLLHAAGKEREGQVADRLWACLLLLMHHVQDWHKWLEKNDLLSKRILDVLENGGWGEARHLCEMLLPLLAHLPRHILTKPFYESFFNAIFTGLDKKRVISSKSERQSWITSLAECLRYLSIQKNDFVMEVTTSVHRNWLEKILSESFEAQVKVNIIKCSASNMASLLEYWLKLSKEDRNETFDQLVRNFWQNIGSTMLLQIDKLSTNHVDITCQIDAHILLLRHLKSSFSQELKKKQSIKFEDESPTITDEAPEPHDPTVVERYNHNLNEVVERVCAKYFEFASEKQVATVVLTPMATLITQFDSRSLFSALARHGGQDTLLGYYQAVVHAWLAGDTMRCRALVDIVFLMLVHFTEPEQDMVLESFNQFPPSVVEWCIERCVLGGGVGARAGAACLVRWGRGALVHCTLEAACARALRDQDAHARDLLLAAITLNTHSECWVSEQTVTRVVEITSAAVRGACGEGASDAWCGELAAHVATALPSHPPPLSTAHYSTLLLELLHLTIRMRSRAGAVAVAVQRAVRAACRACSSPNASALRADAVALLHRHLRLNNQDLNMPLIEHLVSICEYLVHVLEEPDEPLALSHLSDVEHYTKQLFNFQDWNADPPVESFALKHECIEGKLNCPLEDNEYIKIVIKQCSEPESQQLSKERVISYANECLFRAMYINTLLTHSHHTEQTGPPVDSSACCCDALLTDKYFEGEFNKMVYECAVLDSLHEAYGFWIHCDVIEKTKNKLHAIIEEVVKHVAATTRRSIHASLLHSAASTGYYWAYAKRLYERKVEHVAERSSECDPPEAHAQPAPLALEEARSLQVENLESVLTGTGYFHILQVETAREGRARTLHGKYLVMVRALHLAHAHEPGVLDAQFVQDAVEGQGRCAADVAVNLYYRHNHVMLYDMNLARADWKQVVSNVAVVDLLAEAVEVHGFELDAHQWDFTTITLCSLLTSLEHSKEHWGTTKVCMVTRATLALLATVARFVGAVRGEGERRELSATLLQLPVEWSDIFAPDLTANLLALTLHVLQECAGAGGSGAALTAGRAAVVSRLIVAVQKVRWEWLRSGAGPAGGARRVAALACGVLGGLAHAGYKCLAYAALRLVAEPLVLEDAEKLLAWSSTEESGEAAGRGGVPQFALDCFDETLRQLQDVVEAALSDVKIGEMTCEMESHSESHNMCVGWALVSLALLHVAHLARSDLAVHYLELLRERKYSTRLVCAALRLLPRGAVAAAAAAGGADADSVPQRYRDLFAAPPPLSVHASCRSEWVSAAACRVLCTCLGGAGGACARGWWGAAPAREARALEQVVCAYVAPLLVRAELQRAAEARSHPDLQSAQVAVRASSREVVCVQRLEERSVELSVTLSPSHPLVPPRVSPALPPAPNTQWIAVYLAYQNGSVGSALRMWARAVCRRVESAPQCYICYCRLQPATGRLPRVSCHQCRNKFHADCLRKWFTTSNKSNCPLCRATF